MDGLEVEGTPEINTDKEIQAEIDRIDILKQALPEITAETSQEIKDQEEQYQQIILELQAKLYSIKDIEKKTTLLQSYLDNNTGYYQEFIEMGMPVEPEIVWMDFFGSYIEMGEEEKKQINEFLDGLSTEQAELAE